MPSLLFSGEGNNCCDHDGDVRELLQVLGVTVELPTAARWVRSVNEVSLRIDAEIPRTGQL